MSQQQSTSRTPVTLAAILLVVAVAVFGISFYLLDGQKYAADLLEQANRLFSDELDQGNGTGEEQVKQNGLVLPADMSEEFALRLWQEQVDSQAMIGRLVSGEISSLRIESVEKQADTAELKVRVTLKDGSFGPGVIGLQRFGQDWYVAYATGMRSQEASGMVTSLGSARDDSTQTPLPLKDQVDPVLLNTILVQQCNSQPVMREYLDGVVKEVVVEEVIEGPQTVTISVLMKETHGTAKAKIVAIRNESGNGEDWFIARFTKVSADHPDSQ